MSSCVSQKEKWHTLYENRIMQFWHTLNKQGILNCHYSK